MSFVQLYISDEYEYPEDLELLEGHLEALGFNRTKDIFVPLSHIQTTEGYDIYEEVRQICQLPMRTAKSASIVSFELQAIKMEHELDFTLNQMTVRLYLKWHSRFEKEVEQYYGRKKGFVSKEEMIQRVWAAVNPKLITNAVHAQSKAIAGRAQQSRNNKNHFKPKL